MMASSRVFAVLLFILIMGAFMVLINAFITNDFTLSYVVSNANTQLPVRYAWPQPGAHMKVRCCYGCC